MYFTKELGQDGLMGRTVGHHNQTGAGANRSRESFWLHGKAQLRAAFPGRRKLFHFRFNRNIHPAYFPEGSEADYIIQTYNKNRF